jgi:mycothiol synthase
MIGLHSSERLTGERVAAVLALVAMATEEDGVAPLSEHVMLHLRYGGDRRARNLILEDDGEVVGYAHLDPTDPVAGPSGEVVVHPAHRRRRLGLTLLRALVAEAGDGQLRLWAHGDLPAASRLAAAAGFVRVRALWQMRRSLQARLGKPQFTDGITVRTFEVGRDEDTWTALNARAFVRHPEQGAWTRADLDLREQEPWFDTDGFFLAERGSRLVGFHWTKIHGQDSGEGDHAHQAMGEVYVVGVDPDERGTGLGRALTLLGLRYLRSRGLFQAMLYVDESNTAAIGLYESLGFTHWDTDVMFARQELTRPCRAPHAEHCVYLVLGQPPVDGCHRAEHVGDKIDLGERDGVVDAMVNTLSHRSTSVTARPPVTYLSQATGRQARPA